MGRRIYIIVAKLIVQTPFDTFEVYLRNDLTIGRSRSNALRIDGPQVSRNHAVIFRRDNIWQIRDLDSKNGLFVNGISVSYSKLNDGDEVSIGEFRMRFVTEATSGFRIRGLGVGQDEASDPGGTADRVGGGIVAGQLASSSGEGTSGGVGFSPDTVPGTVTQSAPDGRSSVDHSGKVYGTSKDGTGRNSKISSSVRSRPRADIFFRLDDLDHLIEGLEGPLANQFLMDSLGLQKRLMNTERLGSNDFLAITRHLLFSLSHAVNATRGVILKREEDGGLVALASEPASVKLTVSRIVADAALKGLCTLCPNCLVDERFRFSRSIHSQGVASLLCVPMARGKEIFGLIYLDTTDPLRPFRREYLHLVAFISRLVLMVEGLQVIASGNPTTPLSKTEGVLVAESTDERAVREMNEVQSTEEMPSSGFDSTDLELREPDTQPPEGENRAGQQEVPRN